MGPLLVISLTVICFQICVGFNLDVDTAVVRDGPSASYFGFSVALLNNSQGAWLLAGAPLVKQEDRSSGALYKCPIIPASSATDCLEVPLSQTGGGPAGIMQIGTALDMQPNVKDKVVYCGHQVDPRADSPSNATVYGMCYDLMKDLDYRKSSRISPMTLGRGRIGGKDGQYLDSDNDDQIFYFPVHNSEGNTMLVGNPAAQNSKGAVVLYRGNRRLKRKVFPGIERDSFAGYALSSGRLFRDPRLYYIVGAPGAGGRGKVFVLGDAFDVLKEAVGEQTGSYFGASVTAVDLNGDGSDDIVIGAPLYGTGKEEGAVYVYINENNKLFDEVAFKLMGSNSPGAKFGSAIENIGDMNRDLKEDIAVGAPFEDEGLGVIYIYNGHASGIGLDGQYSQRIAARDLPGKLRGFGMVFSRVDDLDGNSVRDFAVGAPLSDSAVVFFGRPVVDLLPRFRFSPEIIDVKRNNCRFDKKRATCVRIEACFYFRGYNLPDYLDVDYSLRADTLNSEPRVQIIEGESLTSKLKSTLRIARRRTACSTYNALVMPNVEDVFTPISFNLTYDIVRPEGEGPVPPVLSVFSGSFNTTEIIFSRDCGEDNVCQSDLVVKTRLIYSESRAYLLIGADETLSLQVNVLNSGEAAYLSEVIVTYSDSVEFLKNPRSQIMCEPLQGETVHFKNPSNERNVRQLICHIGNPLKTNEDILFDLIFDSRRLSSMSAPLEFTTYARTPTDDTNMVNNIRRNQAEVRFQADTSLMGSSIPGELTLIRGAPDNQEISRKISHAYELLNRGPSTLKKASVLLTIPSGNLTSQDVILSRVEVEGSDNGRAKCKRLSTSQNTTDEMMEMGELRSDPCADSSCFSVRCSVKGLESQQTILFRADMMLAPGVEEESMVNDLTVQTTAVISVPDDTILVDTEGSNRQATVVTRVNVDTFVEPETTPMEKPEPEVTSESESDTEPKPESETTPEPEHAEDSVGEAVGETEDNPGNVSNTITSYSIPTLLIVFLISWICS